MIRVMKAFHAAKNAIILITATTKNDYDNRWGWHQE